MPFQSDYKLLLELFLFSKMCKNENQNFPQGDSADLTLWSVELRAHVKREERWIVVCCINLVNMLCILLTTQTVRGPNRTRKRSQFFTVTQHKIK